jgi:hypothetical protein
MGAKIMIRGLIALAALFWTPMASAQDAVADFYRGKQVFLRIGSAPGSGYDLAGRIVAPYLSRYIPGNPAIVVQSVPGAGSLILANQLYNTAPKDGTVIGLVSNGMPTAPQLTPDQARFDATKFSWIGSNAPETQIILLSDNAPAKTVEDLFKLETIVGATAPGVAIYDVPAVLNALSGTKFKIVSGYEGTAQIDVATERGELHGQAALGWISAKTRNMADIKSGKLRILAQFGVKQHPDLTDIPLFPTPADEVDRQAFALMVARQDFGRPLLLPPGVPADRIAALRSAYAQAMQNPDLRKEAERAGLEINPVSGEDLDALTRQIVRTSPAAIAKLRAILSQ